MNYRIKDILKEKGLTLTELAERAGMKSANLSVAFSDKGNPTISTLEKIASALDVPIVELFEESKKGFTALIDADGILYRANTIEEMESIIRKIRSEN